MQKLLFILICLLLSFEVRSENDDLSGKKLVCESTRVFFGFEFLNIKRVKKTIIDKKMGTTLSSTSKYTTSPTIIRVDFIYTIDRLNLKLGDFADCKLIEDNFDSYMDNLYKIILNEIKSKQNEIKSKQKI